MNRIFYRPFSRPYFLFLLFWLLLIFPLVLVLFRDLLVKGLGIPPEAVGFLLFLSLLGSFVNIPITEIRSQAPMFTLREVTSFGVKWFVPRMELGTQRTVITLNVGGAIVPLIISTYILAWAIPQNDAYPLLTYVKTMIVLIFVSLIVNRSSKVVKGLGIATPAFVPPMVTALTTLILYWAISPSSPTQIAYVGGTLGTLIGADLLNVRKLPRLGAPMVSIGGAGTFDGIFTTGLVSVLLVLIFL